MMESGLQWMQAGKQEPAEVRHFFICQLVKQVYHLHRDGMTKLNLFILYV